MKRLLCILWLVFFTANLFGQYYNEWISESGYDKTYYKFPVYSDGIYRIPYSALTAAGVSVNNASNFKIYAKGEQIPVYVSNPTSFGSGDYVEFVGQQNDGEMDTPLFPVNTWQLSDERTLFSDTLYYFLTWDNNGNQSRYQQEVNDISNPPAPEQYFMHRSIKWNRNVYYPGVPFRFAGVNNSYSAFDKAEGWVSGVIKSSGQNTQTASISTPAFYQGPGAPSPTLECKVVGRSNEFAYYPDHHTQVSVGGTVYVDDTYEGYAVKNYTAQIAASSMNTLPNERTEVKFLAVGDIYPDGDDDFSTAYSFITYPREFDFANQKGFQFTLDNDGDKYIEISNFNGGSAPVLYDMTNNKRYTPSSIGGVYKIRVKSNPANGPKMELFFGSTDNFGNAFYVEVPALQSQQFVDLNQINNQGNYVMIYHSKINQFSNGVYPVDAYESYRSSADGGGYVTQALDIEMLYDMFSWGVRKHPLAIRNFANFAMDNWNITPEFLFLIGKSVNYKSCLFSSTISAQNLVPSFGNPAADPLLTSTNNVSYRPQIATGRISANTPADLKNYLDKVIEHESWTNVTYCDDLAKRDCARNSIHLSGAYNQDYDDDGVSDQAEGFLNLLGEWGEYIENDVYRGEVLETYSYVSQVYPNGAPGSYPSSADFQQFKDHLEEGVGIINFLGHADNDDYTTWSWSSGWNFNPSSFDVGKYPMIFSGSCFVGNIHVDVSSPSMAELWTLTPNRGAIGFLAGVNFGFPEYLSNYVSAVHSNFAGDLYGEPIGTCIMEAIDDIYVSSAVDSTTIYYQGMRKTIEEFTWSGDPAVSLISYDNPEYYFANGDNSVTFSPDPITEGTTELTVFVSVSNAGNVDFTPLPITITANGQTVVNVAEANPPTGTSLYTYTIDLADLTPGNNTFTVTVNGAGTITEDCPDNNQASRTINIPAVGNCGNFQIANTQTTFCSSDAPVTLTGTGDSGTFYVNGTPTSTFNPAAGPGTYNIQYVGTITGTSCESSSTWTVTAAPAGGSLTAQQNTVCLDNPEVTFTYAGIQATGYNYSWDFGAGANPPTAVGPGPQTVTYATAGSKVASLTVSHPECGSATSQYSVTVYDAITPPVVNCGTATANSVTVDWNDNPNVQSYLVSYNGTQNFSSDNSFSIPGLTPGEQVSFTVEAIGLGNCGSAVSNTIFCTASDCPDLGVTFNGIADNQVFCANSGPVTLSGFPSNGSFSGSGVAGSTFDPQGLAPGAYTLSYAVDSGGDCPVQTKNVVVVVSGGTTPTIVPSNGSGTLCSDEEITLSVLGDFSSYGWVGGPSTPEFVVTEAGTYTVNTVDLDGCPSSNSYTVVPYEVVGSIVSNQSDFAICPGESIQLSVSTDPGNQILWSNEDPNATIIVDAVGEYSATITAPNGCEREVSVNVVEGAIDPPTFSTSTGGNQICQGQSLTLFGPQGYASYSWTLGGQILQVPLGQSFIEINPDLIAGSTYEDLAGAYQLTVISNGGCSNNASFDISLIDLVPPTIDGSLSVCQGASTTLTAQGDYSEYIWYNDAGIAQQVGPSWTPSQPGEWLLCGTNALGCTECLNFEIYGGGAPPVVEGVLSVCGNSATTLTASGDYEAYTWVDSNGAEIGTGATVSISESGTYSVFGTTSASDCEGQETFVVGTGVAASSPTISGQNEICPSGSTILQASGDFVEANYIWYLGNESVATGTSSYEATTAGTYSVIGSDTQGCQGTSQVFEVTVQQLFSPILAGSPVVCAGGSTTLTAQGDFASYKWLDAEGLVISVDPSFSTSDPGEYSLVGVSEIGCESSVPVSIQSGGTVPEVSGDTQLCEGASSTVLSVQTEFQIVNWLDDTGFNVGTGPQVAIANAGDYTVSATDQFGCTEVTAFSVSFDTAPIPSVEGISEICEGTSLELTAAGPYSQWTWTNAAGEELGTNETLSVSAAGTYTITGMTDADCMGENTIEIGTGTLDEPAIDGALSICEGSTTTLSGPEGLACTWYKDGEIVSVENSVELGEQGDYTLICTDAIGCQGESNFSIAVGQLPEPELNGALSFCENGSTTLSGPEGLNCTWLLDGEVIAEGSEITITEAGDYELICEDESGCQGMSEFTVSVGELPEPIINGALVFCPEGSTTLTGPEALSCTWFYEGEEIGTGSEIIVTEAGEYELVCEDDEGCGSSKIFEVEIEDVAAPVVEGTLQVCADAPTTVSTTDEGTCSWFQDGELIGDANEITIEEVGQYTLVCQTEVGCESSSDFVITPGTTDVEPLIDGITNVCGEESVTLTAVGTEFLSFTWAPADTGVPFSEEEVVEITESGDYILSGIDAAGCSGSLIFDVNINDVPNLGYQGISAICNGSTTVLEGTGDNLASFGWYNLEGDLISEQLELEVSNPGFYTFAGMSEEGCDSEIEVEVVEVELPAPTISGPTVLCPGEEIEIAVEGQYVSYVWSTDGGTQGTDAALTISAVGTYSVLVETEDGCTSSNVIEIEVDAAASPISVISNEAVSVCLGESVSFTNESENGAGFMWTFINNDTGTEVTSEDAAPELVFEEEGVWDVILETFGCGTTSDETGEVNLVTVAAAPSLSIDADQNSYCEGDEVVLTATGADSYSWNGGGLTDAAGEQVTDMPGAGTYTYILTGFKDGCSASEEVELDFSALPGISMIPDSTICPTEPLELFASGGIEYSWTGEGLDDPNSSNPIATISEDTTFEVLVTDENGCSKTGMVTITADFSVCPEEEIKNVITPNGDGKNDTWVLDFIDAYQGNEVKIFNRWGQLVYESRDYANNWDGSNMDGDALPHATYYYIVDKNDGSEPLTGNVTILK